VHTQTKVHVVKDGEIIDSLNSHDFTHYRLKPGEEFDFSGFRNAREFFEKSKPIIPMMNQLKRDIATGNKVVMVTARADFDDKELFLDTFRKFGIDMGKVHVYRAGNSKEGTTEERKKAIIKRLLDSGDFSKAIMYDDAKPNLHTFMELKRDHPQTKFYAWHVSLEGEASEYMREDIMSERKKRKRKPRWGAYGPGPYGGYGHAAGYSGVGSVPGGDGGGVGEASYEGNVGMMEVAKFFKIATDAQKKLFKELLEKGKRGLAWKLIQDVTDTKLQGQEFNEAFQQRTIDKLSALGMQGPYSKRDLVAISSAWSKTLSGIKSSQIMVQDADNPRHSAWIAPEGGGQWIVGAETGYTVKSGPEALKRLQFFLKPTNENFADGRVKGKSRPGRVKRSGASCKGSVTDLRARAKKYGGERGKMYHWCANMKSGRNK
jgi:hypothetical protein